MGDIRTFVEHREILRETTTSVLTNIFTPLIVFLCVKPLCRPGGGYSHLVVVVYLMGTELFVFRALLS